MKRLDRLFLFLLFLTLTTSASYAAQNGSNLKVPEQDHDKLLVVEAKGYAPNGALMAEGDDIASYFSRSAPQCGCTNPRYYCTGHTTGCHLCGGSTRCCYTECYDTLRKRCCKRPTK